MWVLTKQFCTVKKILVFMVVLFSLFVGLTFRIINGIGSNFELDLPYSYQLWVETSSNMVCGPDGMVVTTVDSLNTYGQYIVGYKENADNASYFINNMKTQEISWYSTQEEFEQAFHRDGYPMCKIELLQPSFLFNLFRCYK